MAIRAFPYQRRTVAPVCQCDIVSRTRAAISHSVARASWIDKGAAGLSGLCVVHCLAGSLALAVLAPFGDLLGHQVHVWGLLIAMPLALVALIRGWRAHARPLALALGSVGLALMGGGLTQHGHLGEFLLTASGAALLVTAHVLNLRWMRLDAPCSH